MNASNQLPAALVHVIGSVTQALSDRPKLAALFRNCFPNTLVSTVRPQHDGTTFVITGDIPAMWLRDSAAQVRPYLVLAAVEPAIAQMLAGVIRRQIQYILHDPYANAFNESANGNGHASDHTAMSALVWERKYEIDSLCYPIQLGYLLWQTTGDARHLDPAFRAAVAAIMTLWRCEQNHHVCSPYRFERSDCVPTDTLLHSGRGTPVAVTGMTWSGFRPSDDACSYGYLVPANMFACVVLGYIAEIARDLWHDEAIAADATQLAAEIRQGIERFAIIAHPLFGPIYAYEVDGLGNANLMDDANVPSLLALPYLGYCAASDPIYQNTRRFILSEHNPFFYQGRAAAGIGSPHTPPHHIWPIALAMQGLTTNDPAEREHVLTLLEASDAGTGFMHESFHADDPNTFTRPWFAWANSLFSELILEYCGMSLVALSLYSRMQRPEPRSNIAS